MLWTVLTGDIVNSRSVDAESWRSKLKSVLEIYTQKYDVYRGDSFQAFLPLDKAMECAVALMANMHVMEGIGVRIGLGVGTVEEEAPTVKESTGQAYILSGEAFDTLGKDLFRIHSPWKEVDQVINIIMGLCTEIMARWTTNMAESFVIAMTYPNKNQTQLAEMLQRKQSQMSRELTKSGYQKIQESIRYCSLQLIERC